MCGLSCVHCGKCPGKESFARPFGTCLKCGKSNDPSTDTCSFCGARLVKPPGKPMGVKAVRVRGASDLG